MTTWEEFLEEQLKDPAFKRIRCARRLVSGAACTTGRTLPYRKASGFKRPAPTAQEPNCHSRIVRTHARNLYAEHTSPHIPRPSHHSLHSADAPLAQAFDARQLAHQRVHRPSRRPCAHRRDLCLLHIGLAAAAHHEEIRRHTHGCRDAFSKAPRLGELQEGTALRPHLFLLFRRLPRLPAAQQGRRTKEARDADDEFLPHLRETANLGRARPIISRFHN